jgi:hypothetical protein
MLISGDPAHIRPPSCQISNRWHPKPSSLPRPGLSASVTWCSLGSPASSLTWSGLRTRQEFRRRMEFLCSISSTRHPDACCGRPGDRPLRSLVAPETPSSSFVFAPGRRCSHRCAIQPTKPARSDASGWPCALAGASRQEDDDRKSRRRVLTQVPGRRVQSFGPSFRPSLPPLDRQAASPLAAGPSSRNSAVHDGTIAGEPFRNRVQVWFYGSKSFHTHFAKKIGIAPSAGRRLYGTGALLAAPRSACRRAL